MHIKIFFFVNKCVFVCVWVLYVIACVCVWERSVSESVGGNPFIFDVAQNGMEKNERNNLASSTCNDILAGYDYDTYKL